MNLSVKQKDRHGHKEQTWLPRGLGEDGVGDWG